MCSNAELGRKIDNLVNALGVHGKKLDTTSVRLFETREDLTKMRAECDTWQRTECKTHREEINALRSDQKTLSKVAQSAAVKAAVLTGVTMALLIAMLGVSAYLIQSALGA